MRILIAVYAGWALCCGMAAAGGTSGCKIVANVPFASQLETPIKHYNRAGPRLATAGSLTADDIMELRNQGFDVVVNATPAEPETVAEERQLVEAQGMAYRYLPYTDDGVSETDLAALNALLADESIRVLLHCKAGSRAGALLAMHYLSMGVEREAALSAGRAAGLLPDMEAELVERLAAS